MWHTMTFLLVMGGLASSASGQGSAVVFMEPAGSGVGRPGPESRMFRTTLLHETAHVVLSILNGGLGIPGRPLASISHTTAALTNRGTAFNEGFAIHVETLAAHLSTGQRDRNRFRHEALDLGDSSGRGSEYLRHAADLQGEGFHASFFFACAARGAGIPDEATLAALRLDRTGLNRGGILQARERWLAERAREPFVSVGDFEARAALSKACRERLNLQEDGP